MAKIINLPEIDIPYSRNSPGLNFYSIVERFEPVCSGDQTSLANDHNSYVRVPKNWLKWPETQIWVKNYPNLEFKPFLSNFNPPSYGLCSSDEPI